VTSSGSSVGCCASRGSTENVPSINGTVFNVGMLSHALCMTCYFNKTLQDRRCNRIIRSSYKVSSTGATPTMAMRYKAALIDLSGTLHIGDKVIEGSVESLTRLRKHGLKVRVVEPLT
jgi:hypothetical protein